MTGKISHIVARAQESFDRTVPGWTMQRDSELGLRDLLAQALPYVESAGMEASHNPGVARDLAKKIRAMLDDL
jgi:hypothetical protein